MEFDCLPLLILFSFPIMSKPSVAVDGDEGDGDEGDGDEGDGDEDEDGGDDGGEGDGREGVGLLLASVDEDALLLASVVAALLLASLVKPSIYPILLWLNIITIIRTTTTPKILFK